MLLSRLIVKRTGEIQRLLRVHHYYRKTTIVHWCLNCSDIIAASNRSKSVGSRGSVDGTIWWRAACGGMVVCLSDLHLSQLSSLWPWCTGIVRVFRTPAMLSCVYGGYIAFRERWDLGCRWILAPFPRWPRFCTALLAAACFYLWFYLGDLVSAALAWLAGCIDAYALGYIVMGSQGLDGNKT
jgi:hypothetical protein